MGTVTAFTAARSQEIEDNSIVSGTVDAGTGHLILTKHSGATIDAGLVKSTIPGPPGDVSTAELDAAIASEVTARNNARENDADAYGRGLIGFVEVTTDQNFAGFMSNTLGMDVTGASVTVDVKNNHYYAIDYYAALESWDTNTDFGLVLKTSGGVEKSRVAGFAAAANFTNGMSGRKIIKANATESRTYKLAAYFVTDFEVKVKGSAYPTQIAITDLGLML